MPVTNAPTTRPPGSGTPGSGTPGSGTSGTVVTVRVPATSANLGPGFDALGLALALYDEHVFTAAGRDELPAPGLVTVVGEGAGTVACGDANLVVAAARATAAWVGAALPPFDLACTNRIPHGLGLGSSAAAIVAGVVGARALLGLPRDRPAELAAAARLEGHPDNVAPAVLGGFTVAWREPTPGAPGGDAAADPLGTARAVRLDPTGFRILAYLPPTAVSTVAARGLLPAAVSHADAAHAAGRAALLVAALTGRADLMFPATEDRLHTRARGIAMPATLELIDRLRADGVAAVLSGAGPGVLALVPDGQPDPTIGDSTVPVGWRRMRLDADMAGVRCTPGPREQVAAPVLGGIRS